MPLSVAADTRPELGEGMRFLSCRFPHTVFTGIRSGRCVFHWVPRTLRRRLQSLSVWRVLSRVPCFPNEFQLGRCGAFWVLWFMYETRAYSSGVSGLLELQLPACPTRGLGTFALDGPSRHGQGSEDPGSRLQAGGGRARARWAGSSCSVPIIVNRRRLGGVGMGLPRPARGAAQEAAVVTAA